MVEAAGAAVSWRRLDLRLVPTVLVTWAAAIAGGFIDAVWCNILAGAMFVTGGVFLVLGRTRQHAAARARTVPATLALACVLGAAVAVHCAVTASQREAGPLADAVGEGGVVIEAVVTGTPAEAPMPGHSGGTRWMVAASLLELTSKGTVVSGTADLVVVGGNGWQNVRPGQRVRTTGTLKEGRAGQPQAALLSASSAPVITGSSFDVRQSAAHVRKSFLEASSWLPPDEAGLLPGMVTGDTSALPESLAADMKTTGMTHLTAVSGANCSLVLGGFLLLARSLRLSRPVAAVFAGCGLLAFVLMVGPDPSVLRAAVMGSVGLAALIGGLRGRSLTFLCLATSVLLLLEPAMAANVGFLLSVLATLGIVLLAARIASWVPPRVPRWLAAGVAVPLSAQLLCGPVIVALQPQFTPYALIANVVVGPLVAPVTILGTTAVPLAAVAPSLAVAPVAVAGMCAGAIARLGRFFAGLPGAAVPWAEGPAGVVAMATLSVVSVLLVWALLHPSGVVRQVLALHGSVVVLLERGVWRRNGRREPRKDTSGRSHPWPLPKIPGPRASRLTPSTGATRHQPP